MTLTEAKQAISTLETPTTPRGKFAEEILLAGCTTDLESKLNHDELWSLLEAISTFEKLSTVNKDLAKSFIDKLSSINNNGN